MEAKNKTNKNNEIQADLRIKKKPQAGFKKGTPPHNLQF